MLEGFAQQTRIGSNARVQEHRPAGSRAAVRSTRATSALGWKGRRRARRHGPRRPAAARGVAPRASAASVPFGTLDCCAPNGSYHLLPARPTTEQGRGAPPDRRYCTQEPWRLPVYQVPPSPCHSVRRSTITASMLVVGLRWYSLELDCAKGAQKLAAVPCSLEQITSKIKGAKGLKTDGGAEAKELGRRRKRNSPLGFLWRSET